MAPVLSGCALCVYPSATHYFIRRQSVCRPGFCRLTVMKRQLRFEVIGLVFAQKIAAGAAVDQAVLKYFLKPLIRTAPQSLGEC